MSKLAQIPTNIITGFLGSGKTTAILHLLAHKPSGERWAVLVNEFGEIGVDGALFRGHQDQASGVYIRELPGGCMCCAAGVPMQVALNALLARARPQRLLIEPTGLGHPREVLHTLSSAYYQDLLAIQRVITLVDARQLADDRYRNHDTYQQQIAIADLIVANKTDLYAPDDPERLADYLDQLGLGSTETIFTQQGQISLDMLSGTSTHQPIRSRFSLNPQQPSLAVLPEATELPAEGYLKAVNRGEGFVSVGWRFSPAWVFDRQELFCLLSGLPAERVKAVFLTQEGAFGYNFAEGSLTEMPLAACDESRIELIATEEPAGLEAALMGCC